MWVKTKAMAKKKTKSKEEEVVSSFGEDGTTTIDISTPVDILEKVEPSKPKQKPRGILIFATGQDYYATMAVKLACSIRVAESSMPITLIVDSNSYNWAVRKYSHLFDNVLMCPKDYLYVGDQRTDTKAKCFEDIISPYDETIVIDADSLWLAKKKPSELFEKFKQVDFFQYSRKITDLSQEDVDANSGSYWAKVSDIKKAFNLSSGKFYNCSGEFRYFKKTEVSKRIYDAVREIIDNPKVEVREFLGSKFNEELSFNIAITTTGYEMPMTDFKPVHWFGNENTNNNLNFVELSEKYFILSVGGNQTIPNIKREYEYLCKAYLGRLGINDISAILMAKRDHLSTRRTY